MPDPTSPTPDPRPDDASGPRSPFAAPPGPEPYDMDFANRLAGYAFVGFLAFGVAVGGMIWFLLLR